jgi:hypothetical protein
MNGAPSDVAPRQEFDELFFQEPMSTGNIINLILSEVASHSFDFYFSSI